ncbi:hypothetical protein AK812_SmicGene5260 [Symbiodinium microadriaticum]|uniref:Uncharacterized protein n=1 Tax=Symbiodinium microadriaticum TaxID=2951 RepID=A0A1Q9EU54_SYMMI|nr:hypothetical protein AK812_SmicGene5260 [Symbiodinium microadriaticum]
MGMATESPKDEIQRQRPEDLQINVGEDLFSLKGVIGLYAASSRYGFISSSMWEGDCYFKGKDLPPQLAATDVRGMKVVTELSLGQMSLYATDAYAAHGAAAGTRVALPLL